MAASPNHVTDSTDAGGRWALTVDSVGPDEELGFRANQWVELTNADEAQRRAGAVAAHR